MIGLLRFRLALIAHLILLSGASAWATGSLIHESRMLNLVLVDTQSPSAATRLASYEGALTTAIPAIANVNLAIAEEATGLYGKTIQLRQEFNGIQVLRSVAWLRVNSQGKGTWCGAHLFDGISLPYESFLEDKEDQVSLQSFASQHCPDVDSIAFVHPVIYPVLDSLTQSVSYRYALAVAAHPGPGQLLDWETGAWIEDLPAFGYEVHGDISLQYRPRKEADAYINAPAPDGTQASSWAQSGQHICWHNYQPYGFLSVTQTESGAYEGIGVTPCDGLAFPTVVTTWACNEPWDLCHTQSLFGQSIFYQGNDYTNYAGIDQNVCCDGQWGAPCSEPRDFEMAINEGGTAMHYMMHGADYLEQHTSTEVYQRYFPCTVLLRYDNDAQNDSGRTYWIGSTNIEFGQEWYDLPISEVALGSMRNHNWASYRDVLLHELGHVLQFRFYGEHGLRSDWNDWERHPYEGDASAEGLADFMAAAIGNSLDGYSTQSSLVMPGPSGTPGDWASHDISSPNLSYDDFWAPGMDAHGRGRILSAALWDWRNLVVQSGLYGNEQAATDWVVDRVMSAHLANPVDFCEWPWQIATELDAGGDGFANGWPGGDLMYQAFYVNHGIPCRPSFYQTQFDGWNFYKCVPSASTPQTVSSTGLDPAGGLNLAVGQFGVYTAYASDNRVYFACSMDDGANWTTWRLSEAPYVSGISPSVSVHSSTGSDHVYIAWNVSGWFVAGKQVVVTGTNPCSDLLWGPLRSYAHQTFPLPNTMGDPVVVAQAQNAVILHGKTTGTVSSGIHFYELSVDGASTVARGWIPGTDGALVTSLSAYSLSDGAIYIAWIADNQVKFRLGTAATGGGFNWVGSTQTVSTDATILNKTNVTIAYALGIEGVFVAWQGTDAATGYSRVYTRMSHATPGLDPVFSAVSYMTARCANLTSPSLYVYSDDGTCPTGCPPIGIACSRLYDWQNSSQVVFSGLRVEEASWTWMPPVITGFGFAPSLATANATQGYSLLYLQTVGANIYNLVLDHVLVTYGLTNPPVSTEPLEVTGSVRITAPSTIARQIIVRPGGDLILEVAPIECRDPVPGVIDFYAGGVTVDPGATLSIQGSATDPVVLESLDPDHAWSGITCYGTLNMSYVEMSDCDTHALYIYKPDSTAVIDHCTFTGNKLVASGDLVRVIGSPGAGGKTAWVTNSTITEAAFGRGLYLSECDVKFTNVEVTKCAYANTYLSKVTGTFSNCTFSGPASYQGVVISSSVCTPHFQCCTFEDLAPAAAWDATVWCLPVVGPTFGYEGASEGVSNVFNDSSTALLKFSHLATVNPIIDNVNVGGGAGGRNDWYQRNARGRFLSKTGMSSAFPAQDQYWNHTNVTVPGDTSFAPSTSGSYDVANYQADPWGLCGGSISSLAFDPTGRGREGGLDDGGMNLDSLFAVALQAEHDEDYATAQALFHSVAMLTTVPTLRWQATTHAVTTQRFLDPEQGESWIPVQIESAVSADSARYDSYVYGQRLLASYRTDRGEYETAVDLYTDLFDYGLTPEDSILVALDLVSLQLLIEDDGGHLDAGTGQIPATLRARSHAEAFALEKHLLDAYIALDSEPVVAKPIPTTFKLYQNYPNPFNPSTEIVFDLPTHELVELKVFNTLGQVVTTLVSDYRTAGSYRVLWDGKSAAGLDVASGVYIYQVKAGRYVNAKKMVLIR